MTHFRTRDTYLRQTVSEPPRTLLALTLMLFATACLPSCGSSASSPARAAVVGGQAISYASLDQNVGYAAAFYASKSGARVVGDRCIANDAACAGLRRQVLRRLIEERVVLSYAGTHHIVLSGRDTVHVANSLAAMQTAGTNTALLLRQRVVTTAFLRSLLANEGTVRKVELAVVGKTSRKGYSYHLRVVSFFIRAGTTGKRGFARASRLIADGGPIPAAAAATSGWYAAFRLPHSTRVVLDQAIPGRWTGPFRRSHSWVAIRLIDRGTHPFGRPARLLLQTRQFRAWIGHMVRRAHAICYAETGEEVACPTGDS